MGDDRTRVAIACQGGGSHTAFTAGVLRELLSQWPERDETFELVGISGSSGGAFNALAVWYGAVVGDESTAIETLDALWDDIAASDPADRLLNGWVRAYARIASTGVGLPEVNPRHSPAARAGQRRLGRILERHVDFEAIPELCAAEVPELVVGAVDLNVGKFETFVNEDVTVDAVLASAAVPGLFEAVEIDGRHYWDGLLSQNPPVKDLVSVPGDRTPDELWVIQINPQVDPERPSSLSEIADRRNELAGNISLNNELRTIERVNEWIDGGYLEHPDYTTTAIERIELSGYDRTTKLDRDPAFLEALVEEGERRAATFLEERADG
ncbi:patatin-like phospholipase family protein [Natronococcus sp. JC468]|uniref:patatin-like phospholipase family protein n=1 Tax=Natronococcus sp. JC468 TaxID=1961921 RepID=UPI00143945F8|nr:patatin-like phospholipase family protein [Natronococcus sp. JC468]NKE36778.1 patatin-like phospholipase family protein [Natronococcus sp. JC468]